MAEQKKGMELIDGHYGMPHIDSSDMSIIHQALNGTGNQVFNSGQKCAISGITSSAVTIGTGCGQIQGLYWTITSPQSINLTGDTIYLHYLHDPSDDRETIDLVSGPSGKGGTFPAQDIYFPLYQVSNGSATQLFTVMGGSGGTSGTPADEVAHLRNEMDTITASYNTMQSELSSHDSRISAAEEKADEAYMKANQLTPGHLEDVCIPSYYWTNSMSISDQYAAVKISHNILVLDVQFTTTSQMNLPVWNPYELLHVDNITLPEPMLGMCVTAIPGAGGGAHIDAIHMDTSGNVEWMPLSGRTEAANTSHHGTIAVCCNWTKND